MPYKDKEKSKQYKKHYYITHREELRQQDKISYEQNKEERKQQAREYYKTHKEESKQQHLKYLEKNSAIVKQRLKDYADKHRDKIREYKKQYCEQHKEAVLQYKKEYQNTHREERNARSRDRAKVDSLYKITCQLHVRVRSALRGLNKSLKTSELIGCDYLFLREWLENQFIENMTWDNYGEWHMDHILPCTKFSLINPIHQKICLNYRNLQPMWGVDNMIKHNSLQSGWQEKLYEICFALGIGPKQVFDGSKFPIGEDICNFYISELHGVGHAKQ